MASELSIDAEHEFEALNTLLLVVILGICIVAAYLVRQHSFFYFPESAAAIVVGAIVGGFAKLVYPSTEELQFLTLKPEMFFFVLLPPIIFEAAYGVNRQDFFGNFWSISLYAVFGTIISAFIFGYLVYAVGLLGLVTIDTESPIEALLFGALISAVDPVATLSILGNRELNCNPLLYSLVFGESVLNDAVAIVLFKAFRRHYGAAEPFTANYAGMVLLHFTIMTLGSISVGLAIGLGCCYLFKHTEMQKYPSYEISILFLFAYGSYALAEALEWSGIMSLFFCGITLSHYNSHNLSSVSQVTAHNIFSSLAMLCEYFLFLYIGMGLFIGKFSSFNPLFFLLCVAFCFISRACNIFPLSLVANLGRAVKIPLPMQSVMWFAGLRGAFAFALAQTMPGQHKDLYVSTTLFIVVSTTVVCGGLTEPFLSRMGMRGAPPLLQAASSHGLRESRVGGEGEGETDLESASEPAQNILNRGDSEVSASSELTVEDRDTTKNHRQPLSIESPDEPMPDVSVHSIERNPRTAGRNGYHSLLDYDQRMTFLRMIEMRYMRPTFGGLSDEGQSWTRH